MNHVVDAPSLPSDGCNWGGGCPSLPPPPVVTRRHNTRHKKTRSQIEPRRVPGGKQDNPSREACVCSRVQATTNSFFLFLGSPPGFLFTVTVQQGSHSLSLSLSVPLSSSLTVRALALAKEDRELPESETCPRLSTYSAVSGRTRSQGSYSLSLCSRVLIHCHCHFFVDMPRQKHTADHTDIPLSFDP